MYRKSKAFKSQAKKRCEKGQAGKEA